MVTARYRVRLEWGDCDPAGIVFYPNYFRWFDNAAQHLFETVELPWRRMFAEYGMVGLPIVDAGARFVSPARYGDALDIDSNVSEWRRKTLTITHRVACAGRAIAEGHEVRAWTVADPNDAERLKAATIPAAVRARFETAEAPQ